MLQAGQGAKNINSIRGDGWRSDKEGEAQGGNRKSHKRGKFKQEVTERGERKARRGRVQQKVTKGEGEGSVFSPSSSFVIFCATPSFSVFSVTSCSILSWPDLLPSLKTG
jgi:hypothetical protein